MRFIISMVLIGVMAGTGYTQEKKPIDTDKIIQKMFREKFPPLNGRIQVSIEDMQPAVLLPHLETKKISGGELRFSVVIKNIGEKDFDFSPMHINVTLLDEKGNEFPLDHTQFNSMAHGDSGVYPIKKGESNSKPVIFRFADEKISTNSKYSIVASYIVLYSEPLKFDSLMTMKPVNMSTAKVRTENK